MPLTKPEGCFVYHQLVFKTAQGSYTISNSGDQAKVWIEAESGEGGEFDAQKFFEVVDKFYKDNF